MISGTGDAMTATARILPFPWSLFPTPEQRLRAFVDELARELGADITAKMLHREGYRLTHSAHVGGSADRG